MLDDPITDLSIAMEIDYFQLNRAEYFVPLVVKIPGRELALAKRGGAQHTLIDFVAEVKDLVGGTTITNVRDNVSIKLTDATAAELARRPIEYDAGFTLLPGRYMIKPRLLFQISTKRTNGSRSARLCLAASAWT